MSANLPTNDRASKRPFYKVPSSDAVLNVAPVELIGEPIAAERLPYIDSENLDVLHDSVRMTHIVRREGDSILCVPLSSHSPKLGGEPVVVDAVADPYVAAFLMRQSLLSHLHSIGRRILGLRPITVLADRREDDYLAMALPPGTPNDGLLRVSPVIELDVRVLAPEGQDPFVGLTIGVRVSRRILASCQQLMAAGIDVRGVYVKRSAEIRDPRIAPRLETVGQVESVASDVLNLTDHREGASSILASEAYPQARIEFFDRCVAALFPNTSPLILSRVQSEAVRARQGRECLQKLRSVRDYLARQALTFPEGLRCIVHPFLATKQKTSKHLFPRLHQAQSPVYVFDPAHTAKKCEWPPDMGLNRFGPYSSRGFTPNRPKVCVVCQRTKKGQVEQFLTKFREGLRHDKDKFQPFEKGFVSKYQLGDVDFEFFLADGSSADAYRRAAHSALSHEGPTGPKWNLCFVQIEERFRNLPVSENPYMVCKAAFLSHQLPVQEFTIETTQLPTAQLCYVLNNLSLAVYAKMNGTPWLLQSDQPVLQEMVIGLGSARISDSRLGAGQRVVGITTVFTGDGNYCLANLSAASAYESYRDELLSTLRSAMTRVRTDIQWRSVAPFASSSTSALNSSVKMKWKR